MLEEVAVCRFAKLFTDPPPAIKVEAPGAPVEVDTVYFNTLLYGGNDTEKDVTYTLPLLVTYIPEGEFIPEVPTTTSL